MGTSSQVYFLKACYFDPGSGIEISAEYSFVALLSAKLVVFSFESVDEIVRKSLLCLFSQHASA